MGSTPTTGNEIAIGKVWAAFDTNNTRSYPPPAGTGISLRGSDTDDLGATRNRATAIPYNASGPFKSTITSTTASLGYDFWSLGTPDTYP